MIVRQRCPAPGERNNAAELGANSVLGSRRRALRGALFLAALAGSGCALFTAKNLDRAQAIAGATADALQCIEQKPLGPVGPSAE